MINVFLRTIVYCSQQRRQVEEREGEMEREGGVTERGEREGEGEMDRERGGEREGDRERGRES